MGWQIIKQTKIKDKLARLKDADGKERECYVDKYAIWSSIVDGFIYFNLTREEVIEVFVETERRRLEESINQKLDTIDSGKPAYYQFTMTFEEAMAERRC